MKLVDSRLDRFSVIRSFRKDWQFHLPESDERAADLMSTPVITILEDTSLIEAMSLMLQHQIKRLPVLNEEGELVGLLGRGSLLQGLL